MKTEKAKLMHLLEKDIEFDHPEYGECTAIVSGMTLVLSLVGFPATFRDLADKVLCLFLPSKTVDCLRYCKVVSTKASARTGCGQSETFLLK